jgi:hypothetical protein
VFFTSRFLWQYWSVPISKSESNNETPKAAVPVYDSEMAAFYGIEEVIGPIPI